MNSSSLLRILVVSAATAALVGCGGGGGSDTSGTSAPTAPIQPTNTGLGAPTLMLTQSQGAVFPLVEEMISTYALADEAQAAKALGSLVPGVGSAATSPYGCSGGGQIAVTDTAGVLDYTYTDCSDGTYTFNGTSQLTPTPVTGGAVTSYGLAFTDLQLTIPGGSPVAVSGALTCTPPSTAGQAPSCVSAVGSYVWGSDISYSSNGIANGSHQCDCGQGSWNVTFKDFGATSGEAAVFATNGSAIVTRTGAKTFTVVLFLGSAVQTYTVTLP